MVINIFLQQMLSVQQSQSKHTFIFQQCCWVMRPAVGFSCCHQAQRSSEATAAGWECNVLESTSAPQRAPQQLCIPGLAAEWLERSPSLCKGQEMQPCYKSCSPEGENKATTGTGMEPEVLPRASSSQLLLTMDLL